MNKINYNLSISSETIQFDFEKDSDVYFGSFEDLKKFMSDPVKFFDYKKIKKELADNIEQEVIYSNLDGIDSFDIDYIKSVFSPAEIQKMKDDSNKKMDDYIDSLKKGDYVFDKISISNNAFSSWSIDDIKKCIVYASDKVKTIDIKILSLEQITDIINSIDINDDVRFITKYNHCDDCSISELRDLVNYLNNIRDYITRLNLSPLETCIFLNDLIREREYKESDNKIKFREGMTDEELEDLLANESDSRSLFKVYKSDKIVCAGFANLYSAILELVGINSDKLIFVPTKEKENNNGHVSNLVYLNDDKYDVHGIFDIDTTWGRIENEDKTYNYQKSINNYFHFGRSLTESRIIKSSTKIEPYSCPVIDSLIERCNSLENLLSVGAPRMITAGGIKLIKSACDRINDKMGYNYFEVQVRVLDMYRDNKCDDAKLLRTISKIKEKALNCILNPVGFENALYRVRLIEHSIDREKYPFDVTVFNNIIKKRFDSYIVNILGLGDRKLNKVVKAQMAKTEDFISALHNSVGDNLDKNPLNHI